MNILLKKIQGIPEENEDLKGLGVSPMNTPLPLFFKLKASEECKGRINCHKLKALESKKQSTNYSVYQRDPLLRIDPSEIMLFSKGRHREQRPRVTQDTD